MGEVRSLLCSHSKCLAGLRHRKHLCLNADDDNPPPSFIDLLCAHYMFIQVNSHKVGTRSVPIFQIKEQRRREG